MKVLVLSCMYPHELNPSSGIFVEEQLLFLSKTCEVKVVSPCPWFLPIRLFRKWYRYTLRPLREIRRGLEILRPRYVILPRDFLTIAGISYLFSVLITGAKLRTSFDYEIIHAHGVYPDGFAAILLGRVLRKPVVITVHACNLDKLARASLGRVFFVKFALRNATRVIAVGNSLRRRIVAYGTPERKVRRIPNGVDLRKFRLSPNPVKDDGTKILFVGYLIRRKGVDYLLSALTTLSERGHDNWELTVVGDGRERTVLERKARDLGFDSKVHFLGALPNEDVAVEMAKCDLLVLPSLDESFGVVLIEAMACGKPVVATRCGGPEDIVTEETGLLVPSRNVTALADAIGSVLNHPGRYDSRSIRDYILSNYSLSAVADKIRSLYGELVQA